MAAAAVGLAAVVLTFGDVATFVESVDHCSTLGCDALYYFRGARQLRDEGTYARGYLYSPTFALATMPWLRLAPETARLGWVAGVGLSIVAYVALLCAWAHRDGRTWIVPLVPLLVLTSFPVLHTLKWGQVSVFTVAAALVAVMFPLVGRGWLGATSLVLASVPKYYPGVVIAPAVRRGDWPAVGRFALVAVGVFVLAPVLYFGPAGAVAVAGEALAAVRGRLASADAPALGSQHLPYVIARLGAPAWLGWLCWPWLAANSWVALRHRETDPVYAALALLACTPAALGTAWVHTLAYLPAAQLWVLARLPAQASPRRAVIVGALAASVWFASLGWFALHQHWQQYAGLGWPMWSSLAVNAALWLSWPEARATAATPAA